MLDNTTCGTGARAETWCPTTIDDTLPAVVGLLPPGPAWSAARNDGTVQNKYWRSISSTVAYTYQRMCAFMNEFYCFSVDESLDQWQVEYGLPDDCDPSGNGLCAKVTMEGGQDCASYVRIMAQAGWIIDCVPLDNDGPYAGCMSVGCVQLGTTPVVAHDILLGGTPECVCEFKRVVDHPEPQFWNRDSVQFAHCPVPGSTLGGENMAEEGCCNIVGFWINERNSLADRTNACADADVQITFTCAEPVCPKVIHPPTDVTGHFLIGYGDTFVWRVRIHEQASQMRQASMTNPAPAPYDVALAKCMLERIAPAHTILITETMQ